MICIWNTVCVFLDGSSFDLLSNNRTKSWNRRERATFCICFGHRFLLFIFQANKIVEHRRKYERKREEKEIKEKQERIKKAREEHARAQRVHCSVYLFLDIK